MLASLLGNKSSNLLIKIEEANDEKANPSRLTLKTNEALEIDDDGNIDLNNLIIDPNLAYSYAYPYGLKKIRTDSQPQ